MSLALLSPWQQLLWIVCAAILIVPIVSAGVVSIIRGYFNAKEVHIGRIANAVSKALAKTLGEMNKGLDGVIAMMKKTANEDEKKE